MDFAMPNMDGGVAVRTLTDDPRTRHIPILMLSAFAELVPDDVRLRCAGFLSKPFDCEELAALIQVLTEARERTASRLGSA
jgi:CheY-like chemotaxis protein